MTYTPTMTGPAGAPGSDPARRRPPSSSGHRAEIARDKAHLEHRGAGDLRDLPWARRSGQPVLSRGGALGRRGIPRIFEYFATIMPDLQWDVLLAGTDRGRARGARLDHLLVTPISGPTRGSLWETILMAITATLIGAGVAFVLSFPAAANLAPQHLGLHHLAPVPRALPRHPRDPAGAGLRVHDRDRAAGRRAGHRDPYRGRAWQAVFGGERERPPSCRSKASPPSADRGSTRWAYGIVPQVAPEFLQLRDAALSRSTCAPRRIIGFVGAGGIGQELNRVISFYFR